MIFNFGTIYNEKFEKFEKKFGPAVHRPCYFLSKIHVHIGRFSDIPLYHLETNGFIFAVSNHGGNTFSTILTNNELFVVGSDCSPRTCTWNILYIFYLYIYVYRCFNFFVSINFCDSYVHLALLSFIIVSFTIVLSNIRLI